MKVIEFPKNKQVHDQVRNDKLDVAIEFLKYLVGEGAEYHIVINREDATKLFDVSKAKGELRDYLIMTSDFDSGKRLKLSKENSSVYVLTGDELD